VMKPESFNSLSACSFRMFDASREPYGLLFKIAFACLTFPSISTSFSCMIFVFSKLWDKAGGSGYFFDICFDEDGFGLLILSSEILFGLLPITDPPASNLFFSLSN